MRTELSKTKRVKKSSKKAKAAAREVPNNKLNIGWTMRNLEKRLKRASSKVRYFADKLALQSSLGLADTQSGLTKVSDRMEHGLDGMKDSMLDLKQWLDIKRIRLHLAKLDLKDAFKVVLESLGRMREDIDATQKYVRNDLKHVVNNAKRRKAVAKMA